MNKATLAVQKLKLFFFYYAKSRGVDLDRKRNIILTQLSSLFQMVPDSQLKYDKNGLD